MKKIPTPHPPPGFPPLHELVYSEAAPPAPIQKILDRPMTCIDVEYSHKFMEDVLEVLPKPPTNTSTETFMEVKDVGDILQHFTPLLQSPPVEPPTPAFAESVDIPELFFRFAHSKFTVLSTEQEQDFRDLADDAQTISLHVQQYFNRPRPGQIAPYYFIQFSPSIEGILPPLGPSYPSAQAVQAATLAMKLAAILPANPKTIHPELLQLVAGINKRTLRWGHNYPSDIDAATILAARIFKSTPEGEDTEACMHYPDLSERKGFTTIPPPDEPQQSNSPS